MNFKNLENQLIIITGASKGIGRATAELLALSKAKLILIARNEVELQQVAESVKRLGGEAFVYPCELSDYNQVHLIAKKIKVELGVPDAIINNAGQGAWRTIEEALPQDILSGFQAPFLATFYLTQAFLTDMKIRGTGKIIAVTSMGSYAPWSGAAPYICARYALRGLMGCIREETKGHKISVSLVVLGAVDTDYIAKHKSSLRTLPMFIRDFKPLSSFKAAEAIRESLVSPSKIIWRPRYWRFFYLGAVLTKLFDL